MDDSLWTSGNIGELKAMGNMEGKLSKELKILPLCSDVLCLYLLSLASVL